MRIFKKKNKNKRKSLKANTSDVEFRDFFDSTPNSQYYNFISTISIKYDRAIYIIERNSIKYIIKIKRTFSVEYFEKDINYILRSHNNDNIIKIIDFYENDLFYYTIYEFFDGVTLLDYIKKNKHISEYHIKLILIQISNAIYFLHKHNIIHCDLKLENILIDSSYKIKIIDFDLSIITDNLEGYIADNIFGTMQYIAPESYDLCIYSKKSDIWQIGIVLYILLTKNFPYLGEISCANSHSNLCRQNVFKHINLEIVKHITDKYYNSTIFELLEKMLCFRDNDRIDIIELINELKKIDK